jgi:hypothetical protein
MLTKGDVLAHLGRIKDPRGSASKLKDVSYLTGPGAVSKPVSPPTGWESHNTSGR